MDNIKCKCHYSLSGWQSHSYMVMSFTIAQRPRRNTISCVHSVLGVGELGHWATSSIIRASHLSKTDQLSENHFISNGGGDPDIILPQY